MKLVGVSASIPILQSLPIASASATDLSDYPLLKDGIFDFENTDITQYVDDVQEVFGSEKDMIEEMLSSGELTPQDLKQHLLELAEQPSSVLVERGFSESQIAIIEEYDGIEDAFDYLYACAVNAASLPKSPTSKLLIQQQVAQLKAVSQSVAAFQQEMLRLSQQLPEFDTVMEMYGVGPSLGPQLMAEIGDVRRFSSKKSLIAFAGIEPQPNDSGKIVGNDSGISKVGSAVLRRTLFLIMTVILKTQPQDEPVFQFMNKKRSEGKPYKVYMMASANKFLRIYYARVKAVMDSKHSK